MNKTDCHLRNLFYNQNNTFIQNCEQPSKWGLLLESSHRGSGLSNEPLICYSASGRHCRLNMDPRAEIIISAWHFLN